MLFNERREPILLKYFFRRVFLLCLIFWTLFLNTATAGKIDGVEIDYRVFFHEDLHEFTNRPGTPSENKEEYADALVLWMDNYLGIQNFDKWDDAYSLVQETSVQDDLLIWQVMRDILFLQTVQDSIEYWEEYRLSSPIPPITEFGVDKKLPDSYFKEATKLVQEIYTAYLVYQSLVGRNRHLS